MTREIKIDPPVEIVRACSADLKPLLPRQRMYCCKSCRRAERNARLRRGMR